jgi:multidrug resistance efflux pump
LFGIICAAFGAFLALAAMTAAGARIDVGSAAPAATVTPSPAAVRLTARGQVRPVAEARIGTLTGGTVFSLATQVGQAVEAEQEIARVRHADGMEVLTAPWRGLITSLPARTGDTVTVGTTLAYLGDLSRLQVETNDVDEFIIAFVHEGQPVQMTVDALDGRTFGGWVRRVNLLPERTEQGDEHFPVVIDFDGSTVDLRLGMTVRVNFGERS